MKRIFSILTLAACLMALTPIIQTGCTTTQQTVTYNTLYSVQKGVIAAYSGYNDLVVAGKIDAASLPSVAKAYQKYQVAYSLALSAAQFNPQAIAPPDVIQLANELLNAISLFTK